MRRKKTLFGLMAGASLFALPGAALALSPMVEEPTAPTSDEAVLEARQESAPTKLPAENVDGSKVNATTQSKASAAVDKYLKSGDQSNPEVVGEILTTMEALHATDDKNLSVITWLGYLYTITGQYENSIRVLEMARGASSSKDINAQNLRNLSASYYLSTRYADAITALTELNEMTPNDAGTLSLLGSSLVLSQQYERAIAPLEQAANLLGADDASRLNVLVDLGIAYSRSGQTERALGVFDQISSSEGVTAEQHAWMGYTYLQAGRTDSAITTLERAAELDPENPAVINNLATAYLQRNSDEDRVKARALYRKLAELAPNNPVAGYNLGSMYLGEGNYAEAKKFLEPAARASNDPFAWNNLGKACEGLGENDNAASFYGTASDARKDVALFARNAGFAYIRVKNDALGVNYLQRAIDNGDRDVEIKKVMASAFNRMNQSDKALAMMLEPSVAEASRLDADYWFNLGVIYADKGEATKAEGAYRQSLEIRPNDADTVNNLGVLLWEKGDYEGALDCFKKQQALDPTSVNAKLNVAACHAKLGNLTEAIDIWRGVIRSQPYRQDVRLDLADALWNTGDTPGARFHYATVNRENPRSPRALNGLGMWALLQTQHKDAEGYFRSAVQNDRSFVPAYVNLAIVLERLNRVPEAIKVLEAAVAIDSKNEAVKEELARLKSG